jgi:pimeloyl-ACP methyl ester carboxylesterase
MSVAYDHLPRVGVGGTHLCYDLQGTGPAVVFLHGFSLDLRMWDPQVPAFLSKHRILRYDLRGFGRSDLPDPEVPFRSTEDLRRLLMALGLSRVHLVGLSAGGAVALEFAIEHPEIVERLVLVDSALAGFAWDPKLTEAWDRVDAVARTSGVAAARQLWLDDDLFGTARKIPELRARLEEILAQYSGWGWLHESPGEPMDPPASRRLGDVRARTLVLIGEHDLPDFHRIARALGERIPSAKLVTVPGAGHMLNMEAPEEFNRLVLEFLDAPGSPANATRP